MIARMILVSISLFLASVSSAFAEYQLRSGDMVRVSYIGLPKAQSESIIDPEGFARYPLIGRIDASGKTIEEFQFAAQEASLGRRFSEIGENGLSVTVELDGFQVFAEVIGYRPLYVIGDVLRPGEVAFQPGMTLRAAIAKAGGASAIPDVNDLAQKVLADEITLQRVMAQEFAQKAAQLWRVQALFELDPDYPEPDPASVPISPERFKALMASERFRFYSELESYNIRRADLIDDIDGIEALRKVIDEQVEHSKTIVEADRADLEQIEKLSEQGLAQNARVINSRRAYALSTNQLLELLAAKSETSFRQSDIRTKLNGLESLFKSNLLTEKAAAEVRLNELRLRLQGSREILGGKDLTTNRLRATTGAALDVRVFRGVESEDLTGDVDLDLPAIPGDIIEVGLSTVWEEN